MKIINEILITNYLEYIRARLLDVEVDVELIPLSEWRPPNGWRTPTINELKSVEEIKDYSNKNIRMCAVCYEDMGPINNSLNVNLLLGHNYSRSIPHIFHLGCVRDWLNSQNKCPICMEHTEFGKRRIPKRRSKRRPKIPKRIPKRKPKRISKRRSKRIPKRRSKRIPKF
jgi:hypothetical protein